MWLLILIGGAAIGGGAAYLVSRSKTASSTSAGPTGSTGTGEVYEIVLSQVPPAAAVDDVGQALAHALAWNLDTIEDGALKKYAQGAILTVGFKAGQKTPPLPSVGFSFKVGTTYVTVQSVTRAPVQITNKSFP